MLSLLILSTPTFVMANLLILGALRVNSALGVQLFEYTGETSPDAAGGGGTSSSTGCSTWCCRPSRWRWRPSPGYSRYQRNAMLDVLGQDFIRTARAKGLTRRRRCSSTACAPR